METNKTTKVKTKKTVNYSELAKKYGENTIALIRIIFNNADIKRYTSLAIINWLKQKGIINGDKIYISFYWNKFTISVDGLNRDYSYNEPFFINCFVASFKIQANFVQKLIDGFVNEKFATEEVIVNEDSINSVIEASENKIENKSILDNEAEKTDEEFIKEN